MRSSLALIPILLLASCGNDQNSDTNNSTPKDSLAVVPTAANWPGYYVDTLHCADCPRMETSMWIRSDSSFVLQQRYLDSDSVPRGTMGQWQVVNGLLMTEHPGHLPSYYRYTLDGLLQVNGAGQSFDTPFPPYMYKLADAIGDAIPRMRLTGTFTYMADAQSFQPCGATYNWPCVGGMDMGEEEGEPLVEFTNVDLQKAYLKAVKTGGDPWVVDVICTLGMGPAMEGDGADEYIFIEQVIGTAVKGCP